MDSRSAALEPAAAGTDSADLEAPPAASLTCASRDLSTFCTCWFTIGCNTRCPIDPTCPISRTSASHFISVPPPDSLSSNCVSMFSIAPTPVPFAFRRA